jgi:hypothetical protein
MSVSSTDDQILTALDADAGWQVAARAQARARDLEHRIAATNDLLQIARLRLSAFSKIANLLATSEDTEATMARIREEVAKGNTEATALEQDIQDKREAEKKKKAEKTDHQENAPSEDDLHA